MVERSARCHEILAQQIINLSSGTTWGLIPRLTHQVHSSGLKHLTVYLSRLDLVARNLFAGG
jgi:hypothetical protein